LGSVRRSFWLTLADSYFGLVLQVVSTMVIARILTPEEIGVFAIAAVFSTLASMFRDFGVGEYLIQERELNNDKIAAALALNISVSWMMAAAMFLGAPLVARFYAYPGVAAVMHVQAIGFLLVPFGAVTMAWFRRELNFRPVMICNVAGNVTSFAVSIGMAWAGFGYMSLAWSNVIAIAVTVALSVWYRPATFPHWPSLRGVSDVFHFSKFVSLMYIMIQVARGLPEMVIGRALGAVEVAMFSRGGGLVEMFNRLVMRSVWTVCMPFLAKIDREQGTIAPAYARSVAYVTAVGWPVLAFLALGAFSAIRIVYGPQWDAAVPIAQILCITCAIDLIHNMSREALLTRGLAKEANTLQVILTLLLLVGLLLGVPFGLVGEALGVMGAVACGVVVSQWFLLRCVGLHARDLAKACAPSATLCALSISPAAIWCALTGVTEDNYIVFGVGGFAVTFATWLVAIHLLRHPLLSELEPIKRRLSSLVATAR
jgi:O-antigen/teichoic acid export membrane protein